MFTYILIGVLISYFVVVIYAGIESIFENVNDNSDEIERLEE